MQPARKAPFTKFRWFTLCKLEPASSRKLRSSILSEDFFVATTMFVRCFYVILKTQRNTCNNLFFPFSKTSILSEIRQKHIKYLEQEVTQYINKELLLWAYEIAQKLPQEKFRSFRVLAFSDRWNYVITVVKRYWLDFYRLLQQTRSIATIKKPQKTERDRGYAATCKSRSDIIESVYRTFSGYL